MPASSRPVSLVKARQAGGPFEVAQAGAVDGDAAEIEPLELRRPHQVPGPKPASLTFIEAQQAQVLQVVQAGERFQPGVAKRDKSSSERGDEPGHALDVLQAGVAGVVADLQGPQVGQTFQRRHAGVGHPPPAAAHIEHAQLGHVLEGGHPLDRKDCYRG